MTHPDWATISTVINIILVFLLAFQWFWDRSREHAVKNNILAARRAVSRMSDPANAVAATVLDIIDAALATIGARRPFKEWSRDVYSFLRQRLKKEKDEMLAPLPAALNPTQSASGAELSVSSQQK